VRLDFGVPSLVTFFGRAKKVTDAPQHYQAASRLPELPVLSFDITIFSNPHPTDHPLNPPIDSHNILKFTRPAYALP